MKLLNQTVIILFIFIGSIVNAQSKRSANKLFKELAYKEAALAYTNVYESGDKSYKVISRIADSYYFNSNTVASEKWYEKLIKKFIVNIENDHMFRYIHSLQGNEKYDEAKVYLKKLQGYSESNLSKYYKTYSNPKYKISYFENLNVNSKFSDFGATIHNGKFYYASANKGAYKDIYDWNKQPFLNLYSGFIKDSEHEAPKVDDVELFNDINTKYHESNAIFTKDGNTMYFTRDNYNYGIKQKAIDNKVKLKIYKRVKVDGEWAEEIIELPFNNNQYSVGHPALSRDEKTLYFVSDMPGGLGATDIYKVSVDGDTYGEPINLGDKVNTKEKEMFPFVTGSTLYFSSDGHLGLGGLDVFETTISGDKFGAISNLQKPFNSKLDDFAFYINKAKTKGFVSSNRLGGKGDDDIYSFSMMTKCERELNGVVKDAKTQMILANANVILRANQKVIFQTVSDQNGKFSYNIDCMKTDFFDIEGNKNLYTKHAYGVEIDKLKKGEELVLLLKPEEVVATVENPNNPTVNSPIVIHTIYFNFDRAGIRNQDSRPELDKVVSIMNKYPKVVIDIESHTDSRGSKAYNRRLSQKRANSTRNYIVSKGIASSRIRNAKGYGESRLKNNCSDRAKCSEEEHQSNRRSNFIVVKGGETIKVVDKNPDVIDRKPGK